MWVLIKDIIARAHEKARREKVELFLGLCRPGPDDLVVDVGVEAEEHHPYDNMLEKMCADRLRMVGLGVGDAEAVREKYGIDCLRYDGDEFPFADSSVDIVYSNAVIEHVGDLPKQQRFLQEMLRVAGKAVFFTTPNRWFPLELHTKIPFVHYLCKDIADGLYGRLARRWATGDYMHLLSRKELVEMLRLASRHCDFEYSIIPNRFAGLPVTYSVFVKKGRGMAENARAGESPWNAS